ncbi:MAG: V-type ATP synthase subunit D [Kiritimatiellae bacterium]|nr:V-type ATP synthase subunit D [Kiritimatiellia bacterium]
MPRIKHTKNELKAQTEALARYTRFLPMLQLKKQQLQMELLAIDAAVARNEEARAALYADLNRWLKLFAEPVELGGLVRTREIRQTDNNIAGVTIPVFEDVVFERAALDLFETPAWLDDAQQIGEQLIRNRAERDILAEQRRIIAEELRTTTQRVNLFEKVKIPECRENIRVIKIFLGDEQTAGVVRAKIAKRRTLEYEWLDAAAGIAGDGIQPGENLD